MIAVAILVTASCSSKYEEEWPELQVNYSDITLSAKGGVFVITVHYDGGWTASVPEGTDWAEFDVPSGTGVYHLKFIYMPNEGPERTTAVTITADNGTSKEIQVTQKAG